ncbi:hypothetical protein [Shewanella violacea]|uniref:Uncharacterized protein n=1 Tax=Shewanella violacea (strain JCM 10179 / CIP 106290 / LMG 19151 / DSS12) TaxID=637905 RepID=D4ZLF4_SHEVD|nr:hypothetical protein [Shewanella violacea]BAJ02503.1 conserved hypothetical protein [Shewanella violacea DSS12]
MFEPLLTQPEILTLKNGSTLNIYLNEAVSDFGLLQAMSGHIGEFILVEVGPESLSILFRLHPFLSLKCTSEQTKTKPHTTSLSRGAGQGWRLFSGLGVSPNLCGQQLRSGLAINVDLNGTANFTIVDSAMWQLVALEEDLRLFHGPRELVQARSLVSREVVYDATTEQILLELSELENVRSDLSRFGCSELVLRHADVSEEVLKLDAQLSRKKQWLSRSFNQSVERPNWQDAANQKLTNDVQARKLEYYRLLSTPAVNEMIQQLILDEE